MGINLKVRVGVEWVEDFPKDQQLCEQQNPGKSCEGCTETTVPDIENQSETAEGFYNTMGKYGHIKVFDWGNGDVWATDFEHPNYGGDSLNWSDNVHFFYYADHGGNFKDASGDNYFDIGFAKPHNACFTSSKKWHLGAKMLKWIVLSCCDVVLNASNEHVISVWGSPMQGIHLILGFIGDHRGGADVGSRFAEAICNGASLGNAWLDTGYQAFSDGNVNRPIAIAAGESRDDAINRREYETLNWRDFNVKSTNWLAWKWRG